MVWLPRNAKKCIFFTTFSPFLAKKIFFSKIRLRQFFGTIKSYLDTKTQKKLWGRSSGIYSDGRTDGRTSANLWSLPNYWVGPKMFKLLNSNVVLVSFVFLTAGIIIMKSH